MRILRNLYASVTTPLPHREGLGVGLFCLLLLSFVSCGGSDDSDDPTPVVEKKATSARAGYSVTVSQDLLSAATVTVYYIDANGQQAQENMTQTTWSKTVTIATLPAQASFSVQPRLKGEATGEAYTIEAAGLMSLTVLDQDGNAIGTPFAGSALSVQAQIGGEYLGQFLTRIAKRVGEAKSVAANGTIADTTITWGGNTDADDPNRDTGISSEGASGTTRNIAN